MIATSAVLKRASRSCVGPWTITMVSWRSSPRHCAVQARSLAHVLQEPGCGLGVYVRARPASELLERLPRVAVHPGEGDGEGQRPGEARPLLPEAPPTTAMAALILALLAPFVVAAARTAPHPCGLPWRSTRTR